MRSFESGMPSSFVCWLRRTVFLCIAIGLVSCGGGSSQGTNQSPVVAVEKLAVVAPNVSVTGITKLSETRISRTVYDYVFQVTVKNNGTVPLGYVTATLTGAGTGTTIVKGTVQVGYLAAGESVTPQDTITLRQDRTYPFNATALIWQVTVSNVTTTIIGAIGGSINSSDNKINITIPPDVLASDTAITVTKTDDNMMQVGAIYNVSGPGGADLIFSKPVTITINYDPNLVPAGTSEENLRLELIDPMDGWETLPDSTVNTLNHTVTATTVHFSSAAVMQSYVAISNPILGFPLLYSSNGDTPYTAQIASVFDHAMITKNCPGNGVTAYTGETGSVQVPGSIEPSNLPGKVCASKGLIGNLYSYYKADNTPFIINGHYKGTATSGNTVLNYDGHAGIDYPVDNENVYAATSGTVSILNEATCWNTDDTAINNQKNCYGQIMITDDKDPAYQTYYLHLSKKFKKGTDHISKGELLGISGNTSPTPIGKHLHFQVNKDVNKITTPVDPYGWDGAPGTDPYSSAIGGTDNVRLWDTACEPFGDPASCPHPLSPDHPLWANFSHLGEISCPPSSGTYPAEIFL